MRILWHSNAPWAKTGYGNQTALFWHRIQRLGYPVFLSSNYGLQGSTLDITEGDQRTRVYPPAFSPHGNDIIASHAAHTRADIVITLYDIWVFGPDVTTRFRWCPWMPVDHAPCPPQVADCAKHAYQAIAYSRFGQEQLKAAGVDAAYVPHGINTALYTPGDREAAREAVGFPEQVKGWDFLAVMVAANKGAPSRKSFPQVLMAWKAFVETHPNALLYIHAHAGVEMAGVDLEGLTNLIGIPKRNVLFADPYWQMLGYPDTYLNTLYNAADVLLSPSMGEGFGLPIVEAQAAGCPVITGAWTSMPELTFAGWMVEGEPFPTPQMSYQFLPYVRTIRDAVEMAYDARGDQALRDRARVGALPYNVDAVLDAYWKPLLAQIAAEVDMPKPEAPAAVPGMVSL